MTLLVEKGFQQEDFANLHPGGRIGKRLMRVEALMHAGRLCPIVRTDTPMRDVIYEMNSKALGMTCVVDDREVLVGIITDGGVRDLDEMRGMGFNAISKAVLVSHAYTHLVCVGVPVTVGGLIVHPGDLLAADQHGVIQLPHEIAREVAAAAQRVEDDERKIIGFYRAPNYKPGDRDGGRYP